MSGRHRQITPPTTRANDRRSAGDVAWWRNELLMGSRELTCSTRERGLLVLASCESLVMFASKRLWKPLREALRELRDEPADE